MLFCLVVNRSLSNSSIPSPVPVYLFIYYSFNKILFLTLFFSYVFFQVERIVAGNSPGLPIPTPKGLIFHSLFFECAAIERSFQTQLRSQDEWLLFEWGQRTIELLPPTIQEIDWDLSAPVPPPFDQNAEVAHEGNFEVKNIFLKI